MANQRFKSIKACVFDAYGTLFNVQAAVDGFRETIGEGADKFAYTWRSKQLEYTWLRSMMNLYTDFWEVTLDALDYTLQSHKIDDKGLREQLMEAYMHPQCYPEVTEVLLTLKQHGLKIVILSNGSPFMLKSAVSSTGLDHLVDLTLSVEEVEVYKPDPRVYQLAVDRLRLSPKEISFQSSNSWDVAGAATFGLRVAWINRSGVHKENLPFGPDAELASLRELPALLGLTGTI
jgi:2-haloacid dehalogenase